jgi:hypothetical protein
MRNFPFVIALFLLPVSALAEPSGNRKPDTFTPSGKQLPVKSAGHSNPCAVYGQGFAKIEGTDTCVKIGGAVSIGAGTSFGR